MYLRSTKTPRYYYHITEKRWGTYINLRPRTSGKYRCEYEPKVPRICVTESVERCLSAIFGSMSKQNIFIYRTLDPIIAHFPYNIVDSMVTREKWILEPCRFMRAGKISVSHCDKWMADRCGDIDYYGTTGDRDQKKALVKFREYVKTFIPVLGVLPLEVAA